MTALSLAAGLVQLFAIVALARARGVRGDPRARLALQTLSVSLGYAVLAGVWVVVNVSRGVSEVDPSQKAQIYAQTISEAINASAFLVASLLLPVGVAIYLARTAKRER